MSSMTPRFSVDKTMNQIFNFIKIS